MTPTPRCRWCDQSVVKHDVGSSEPGAEHVTVWVHLATNVTWCFAGAPALVATPKGRWR